MANCRQRYLHTRMLIMLHPLLHTLRQSAQLPSGSCSGEGLSDSTIGQGVLLEATDLCISNAKELVDILAENLLMEPDLLPPPWYTIFCTSSSMPLFRKMIYGRNSSLTWIWLKRSDIHSCAIVFLIGRLCPPKHVHGLDEDSFNHSWSKCLSVLSGYEIRSQSAQSCHRMLKLLHQEISTYQRSTYPTSYLTMDTVSY